MIIKIIDIIIDIILMLLVCKYFNDSGIKSKIDTDNMMPDAKAQADEISLFSFLISKKIGIVPNMVDKPAKVVKINGYNI